MELCPAAVPVGQGQGRSDPARLTRAWSQAQAEQRKMWQSTLLLSSLYECNSLEIVFAGRNPVTLEEGEAWTGEIIYHSHCRTVKFMIPAALGSIYSTRLLILSGQ